jgi:hypothetical protein
LPPGGFACGSRSAGEELDQKLGLVNQHVRSYDPKTLNVLRAFKVDHSADAPPVLRDRELTLVDRPRDVREQGRHRLTELGTRRVEIALRVGDRG